jgi:hypothetical protein
MPIHGMVRSIRPVFSRVIGCNTQVLMGHEGGWPDVNWENILVDYYIRKHNVGFQPVLTYLYRRFAILSIIKIGLHLLIIHT